MAENTTVAGVHAKDFRVMVHPDGSPYIIVADDNEGQQLGMTFDARDIPKLFYELLETARTAALAEVQPPEKFKRGEPANLQMAPAIVDEFRLALGPKMDSVILVLRFGGFWLPVMFHPGGVDALRAALTEVSQSIASAPAKPQ